MNTRADLEGNQQQIKSACGTIKVERLKGRTNLDQTNKNKYWKSSNLYLLAKQRS